MSVNMNLLTIYIVTTRGMYVDMWKDEAFNWKKIQSIVFLWLWIDTPYGFIFLWIESVEYMKEDQCVKDMMIMRWWCQIYMVADDWWIVLYCNVLHRIPKSKVSWKLKVWKLNWLLLEMVGKISWYWCFICSWYILTLFCLSYPILCWADIHRNVDWYDMYVSLVHLSRNMILIYWNYTQQLSFHDIQASNRTCDNDQEYLWSNDMLHALWHYKHCEDRWMWLSLWR